MCSARDYDPLEREEESHGIERYLWKVLRCPSQSRAINLLVAHDWEVNGRKQSRPGKSFLQQNKEKLNFG